MRPPSPPACRLVSFATSALEAAYAYLSGLGRWVKFNYIDPDGQSITRLGPQLHRSSRSGNYFLVGNPNHLLRQALLLFLHCFRLMAIMPLPAPLTSSTRLPAQTQTHKPRLLFRVVLFLVLCSLQTPDSFIHSLGFSLVRLLISSSVVG